LLALRARTAHSRKVILPGPPNFRQQESPDPISSYNRNARHVQATCFADHIQNNPLFPRAAVDNFQQ
jgi:hypothetical protein